MSLLGYLAVCDRNGHINSLCVVGASAGSSEGASETFEAWRSSTHLRLGF